MTSTDTDDVETTPDTATAAAARAASAMAELRQLTSDHTYSHPGDVYDVLRHLHLVAAGFLPTLEHGQQWLLRQATAGHVVDDRQVDPVDTVESASLELQGAAVHLSYLLQLLRLAGEHLIHLWGTAIIPGGGTDVGDGPAADSCEEHPASGPDDEDEDAARLGTWALPTLALTGLGSGPARSEDPSDSHPTPTHPCATL